MNRINWIDWAKCLAVMTVVFCHLPQPQELMYFRYLQACIITVFFFLSGYLKRDRGSMHANCRKYLWGLAVPYVVYNLLMLPYWVLRYYVQQGVWPSVEALSRPLIGMLLMEHTATYAEPLNGTLWYLPVILLMHLATDLCHRTRYEHWLMAGLCAASFVGNLLYKYCEPHPTLAVTGLLRRLPYFYLGYIMGRRQWLLGTTRPWRDLVLCIGCFCASALLFRWHVDTMSDLALHVSIFYPVNILFVLGVVYGCRLLQQWTPQWVVNVSVGTLVVIGLQWMFIGIINFAVTSVTSLESYTWSKAAALTMLITALHYPIILWARRSAPLLLGRGGQCLTKFSSESS